MAVAYPYCLTMFVWYGLLSSFNKANTLHIKRKLWKWMPTVIERANSDQSPLRTVIVSVDQVDWQIMHIYKQPLRHRHTLIIFFLSASVSLYRSKTTIHTHTCIWFPLQASKRDLEWRWGKGLIWESIRKLHYPLRLPLLLLRGQRDVSLCVLMFTQVGFQVCVPVCGCTDVYVESLLVNQTKCSRTKLGQKLKINKAT